MVMMGKPSTHTHQQQTDVILFEVIVPPNQNHTSSKTQATNHSNSVCVCVCWGRGGGVHVHAGMCACVCVCVRERERERECECVYICRMYNRILQNNHYRQRKNTQTTVCNQKHNSATYQIKTDDYTLHTMHISNPQTTYNVHNSKFSTTPSVHCTLPFK